MHSNQLSEEITSIQQEITAISEIFDLAIKQDDEEQARLNYQKIKQLRGRLDEINQLM